MSEESNVMPVVTPRELADLCIEAADEKKAENIVCLEVGAVTFIADYFIVCSANSTTQLSAIQSNIVRSVREKVKVRPISTEGDTFSGWILVDFGSVLVHIMTQEMRDRYQLERLWGDAPTDEDRQSLEMMRPGV